MTLYSRENVLANLIEDDGVESGDELMQTDEESSDYDKSELSGEEESDQNVAYDTNEAVFASHEFINAERLENALLGDLPAASTTNVAVVQTISSLENRLCSNTSNFVAAPVYMGKNKIYKPKKVHHINIICMYVLLFIL